MNFTPKSEEEVVRVLLPNGRYPFQVVFAEEKTSKAGNAMIELKLQVAGPSGQAANVRDFLMDTEGMAFKLRHFCYAVDLGETYMTGQISANFCVNRQGYCEVYIEKGKTQDGRPFEANKIRDYVPREAAQPTASAGGGNGHQDDDAPNF